MFHLDDTKMLAAARASFPPSKKFSMAIELLIFLLIAMISTIPQSIISSLITTFLMLVDPDFHSLLSTEELSQAAISEFLTEFMGNLPSFVYAILLACSGFMILVSILYCRWFQKRRAFSLGFTRSGVVKEYLLGAIIGIVMISVTTVACLLTRCVTINGSTNADPLIILLFFAAFLIQGMGEEALFRGYLLTSISRGSSTTVAIIVSSLMFSLFHISNSGFSFIPFINIFLFGVFAAVFMLKRGSIWAVGAIHAFWNFMQGNVFGFSVSGNPKFESIFETAGAGFGSILSGGDFGLEGGLGATIVLLIAILVSSLMPTKKSELAEPMKVEDTTM